MSIDIATVKSEIGITDFKKTELLEIALTHPSRIYENDNNRQQQVLQEREYRRLAILGDAILNAIVIDYLYTRYPTFNQGEITILKSKLVSRKNLSEFAKKLHLKQFCLLGGSEEGKDESQQQDLFGEMFEAVFGAIYLEFERDFARTAYWLVERFVKKAVDALQDTNIPEETLPPDCLEAIRNLNSEKAVELLYQMKAKADDLLAGDEQLQQLLRWINMKSIAVEVSYNPVKVRAFYLAIFRILGLAFARNFDPNRGASAARQFALSFERANKIALDIAVLNNPNFDPANVLISVFTINLELELRQALQQLQAELPNPEQDRERFEEWRQENGQKWMDRISELIGNELQLNKQQKKLLQQYYDENKLLMQCLSAAKVSAEVRQEIEDTLLLPIAAIEKRQQRI